MIGVEPLESRMHFAIGLTATFFDHKGFSGEVVERHVEQVNLQLDGGAPAGGILPRGWSARWSGQLIGDASKDRLIVRAAQRVRVWLDGEQIIENWADDRDLVHVAEVNLDAGRRYDLRIDYEHRRGEGDVQLFWRDGAAPRTLVPEANLRSYATRAAVIGDYGDDGQPLRDVAHELGKFAPHFIVTTGDNNYGAAGDIDQNVGQYFADYIGSYHGAFGDGAGANQFFPVIGNHEYSSTAVRDSYFDYFTLPGNERYYQFRRGPVEYFMLNGNVQEPDGITQGSVQGQWLRAALAASEARFQIVVVHQAPYSSGIEHGSTANLQWPFKKWGAEAVLAGHDHVYERIVRSAVPYFVNGLGGRNRVDDFIADPVAGSEVRFNDDFGFMLMQANKHSVTFQFLTRAGAVIDSYTI